MSQKNKKKFSETKIATLLELLRVLKKLHPDATIHGHNEFAAKACPCFNAYEEYKNL